MSEDPRLYDELEEDLETFINATVELWIVQRVIKTNSWGVQVVVAKRPGSDFTNADAYYYGDTRPVGNHPKEWFQENAEHKNLVCRETGMDSHEVMGSWQGLVPEGGFPWPGGIIDPHYGLLVGTSGFQPLEDLFVSRTIRNYLVMRFDFYGQALINQARERAEQRGTAKDRFIR